MHDTDIRRKMNAKNIYIQISLSRVLPLLLLFFNPSTRVKAILNSKWSSQKSRKNPNEVHKKSLHRNQSMALANLDLVSQDALRSLD